MNKMRCDFLLGGTDDSFLILGLFYQSVSSRKSDFLEIALSLFGVEGVQHLFSNPCVKGLNRSSIVSSTFFSRSKLPCLSSFQ